MREGLSFTLERGVVTDQYGIRTQVRAGSSIIKFEIVHEARISLAPPGVDDAVFSRDLIDLAMQRESASLLRQACAKAEGAYGAAVREIVAKAVQTLRQRPHRLAECMAALGMHGVSAAQLWHFIRRIEKGLA